MPYIIALALGSLLILPDYFANSPAGWPDWMKNPIVYLIARSVEIASVVILSRTWRAQSVVVFVLTVCPALAYRIWTHHSLSDGVHNLTPVAVGFELAAILPAAIIAIVLAFSNRSN